MEAAVGDALDAAMEEMRERSSADLIDAIERTGYYAQPGPLANRLEWQELKRRCLNPSG